MPTISDDGFSAQNQLLRDKQAYTKQADPTTPKWLQRLTSTSQHSAEVAVLVRRFTEELSNIDLVRKTSNAQVLQNYFETLAKELIRIYYVRLRVVDLSDKLSPAAKGDQTTQLQQELKKNLANLALLLSTPVGAV